MSGITIGKIVTRREDERRDHLWNLLRAVPWRGHERGLYAIELPSGESIIVPLEVKDLVVIQQVRRLLDRIVEENAEAIELALSDDDEACPRAVAWYLLSPVRAVGYGEGEYEVTLPGGVVLSYEVTSWDAMLLQRLDLFLAKVATTNNAVVERVVSGDELAA